MLFTTGNTKLGQGVLVWSLPAITTCPGASESCRALCYAAQGHYHRDGVKDALALRKREARKKNFVDRMVGELKGSRRRLVRIHCSGDLYDELYARAWLEIIRACPDKIFLMYSRSWSVEDIFPVLVEMSREPNLRLWFSCDRETGRPPRVRRVRRAYMSVDDQDQPKFPVDLVFRVTRKTVMKFTPSGHLVCPVENGVTSTTCDRCQLCFSADRLPRRSAS